MEHFSGEQGSHSRTRAHGRTRVSGTGSADSPRATRTARTTRSHSQEAAFARAQQAEAQARENAIRSAAESARGVISNPQNIPTGRDALAQTRAFSEPENSGSTAYSQRQTPRRRVQHRVKEATPARVTPEVQASPSGRRAAADSRRRRQYNKGVVKQLAPHSSTQESSASYSRRMNNYKEFERGEEKRTRRKRIGIVLATIVLAVAAAFAAFSIVFDRSVNSNLQFADQSAVKSALTAPSAGQPYYVLLTLNLDPQITNVPTAASRELGAMLLVRVDEQNKRATVITMQKDLRIAYAGAYTTAAILYKNEGEAALVSSMATFLDVPIAHVIHLNSDGFEKIINDLGGVTLTLSEAVDDPSAGSVYLAPGEQTLNGEMASVLLLASSYTAGTQKQMEVQGAFVQRLAQLFFTDSGFSLGSNMDEYAKYLSTDLSIKELTNIYTALQGITAENVYVGSFAGYDSKTSDGTAPLFVADATNVAAVLSLTEQGLEPVVTDNTTQTVDRSSFEITVKNGGGITGGATQVSNILTEAGFTVAEVGNAEAYVYTETLVVYLDSQYLPAAQDVLKTLGIGRVIDGTNFYLFDTEILVMVGSDWKPLN